MSVCLFKLDVSDHLKQLAFTCLLARTYHAVTIEQLVLSSPIRLASLLEVACCLNRRALIELHNSEVDHHMQARRRTTYEQQSRTILDKTAALCK